MVKKEVLAKLIDEKKAAVLQIILSSKEEVCLKEVAEKSQVSITSTFRILQELVGMGVLKRREWKNSIVYCPEDNEKASFLRELFYEEYDGLQEFVVQASTLEGVQSIVLQGAKKKDKASLMLIGEKIELGKVNELCQKIKDKGFEVTYLTLTQDQYGQMVKMGLYPGEKKVLK